MNKNEFKLRVVTMFKRLIDTYFAEDNPKAVFRMHSTTHDAARCALEAGVGQLLVAHYSSNIKEEEIHGRYEQQLKEIFPASRALDDGDIIDLPIIPLR